MGIEFAKKGADIVLVSRSEEKLKLALQKVEVCFPLSVILLMEGCSRVSRNRNSRFYSADLTNAEEAKKAITSCERVPDIVMCCAGIVQLNCIGLTLGAAIPGFFADQTPEVLDFMMKTIYYTALWTAHVSIPP